jgi:hypothetical protein
MPVAQENPSESGKQTNPVHKIRKWKTKTHMVIRRRRRRRRRNGQQVWELHPTAEAAAAQQQQEEEEVDRTSANDVRKVDTTEMHQGNRETNNSSRRKDQMAPRSLIRCTR